VLNDDDQRWIDQVQRFIEARAGGVLTWTVQMQPPGQPLGGQLRQGIFYVRLNGEQDGNWVFVETGAPEMLLAANTSVFSGKPFDLILQGTAVGNKANPFPLLGEPRQGDWPVAKFMGVLQQRKKIGPGQWTAQMPLLKAATKDLFIPITITFSKDIDWPSLPPGN
jgi:hypothetical protein